MNGSLVVCVEVPLCLRVTADVRLRRASQELFSGVVTLEGKEVSKFLDQNAMLM